MKPWIRFITGGLALSAAYGLLQGRAGGIPEAVALCLGVLALVVALGVLGWRSRPRRGIARTRRLPAWKDYGAVGAVFLAVEFVLLAFFSWMPMPLERIAATVESWLEPGGGRPSDVSPEAMRGGNWLWSTGLSRPLPRRADFKPGNRPEIFLRPEDPEVVPELMERRLYVHSFAFERYQDGVWSAQAAAVRALQADNDGWLRLADRPGDPRVLRVFHGDTLSPEHPLAGLQGIVGVEIPALRERGEGLHLLPPPPPGSDGYEYRVASCPALLDDLRADAKAGTAAHSGYLALPHGPTGERLATYAREAAGQGDMVSRLRRLRDKLAGEYGYSLTIVNERDLDPLENFLFHEKRGHCELFATAGALMARALGVPARIVYGWSGGTYFEGGNLFVFRAREAHAWAEILVEGVGWTVFDPTPPGALERELAAVAPPDAPLPTSEDGKPVAHDPEPLRSAGTLRVPWWVVATFLLPVAAVVVRRWMAKVDPDAVWDGEPVTDTYLVALRRAWRRHGRPLPIGRTLRRHLLEAGESPDFAVEAVRYHYAVKYGGASPDPALEKTFVRRAEDWS